VATYETSIPSDPTQERFAEAVLVLDHILSIMVDRVLWMVDHQLEERRRTP
jgi:hypothetical protein